MASSSSSPSSSHGHHQQQQQQSFQQQLRHQHHQPPPLSHGLNSSNGGHSTRGPSPPHPHGGVPPHLPISGSSVSYSDDNTGGGGSSFNILNMQASFDDSSSHLDLPSLLQANGNNGGRDVRLGVGLDHHQHHYNHQYQQHHHHQQQHHHQHSSWSAHAVDPLPPVALCTPPPQSQFLSQRGWGGITTKNVGWEIARFGWWGGKLEPLWRVVYPRACGADPLVGVVVVVRMCLASAREQAARAALA
jgi:hypothetical protein